MLRQLTDKGRLEGLAGSLPAINAGRFVGLFVVFRSASTT